MKLPDPLSYRRVLVRLIASTLALLIVLTGQQDTDAVLILPTSSYARGDANGDGLINFSDVAPFVLALSARPMYETQHPELDADIVLDMNNDGVLNFLDISGFASALSLVVQPPTELQTLASGSANSIGLTWTDSTTDEVTGYRIQFGLDAGSLTNSLDVGNVTTATISGLTSGQTYHVAVIAVASGRLSQVADALITAQSGSAINIAPLFDTGTQLEAATTVETPAALTTYLSDRVRDRHAREGMFEAYDHYLSWYWEQRMMNIEIIDRVGRNGGTNVTFNYTTQRRLNPAEFRTFYRGITTLAEYSNNQTATLVSNNPSATPGETDFNYSASISHNPQLGRELRLGDRVEIEISQFLLGPRNGRSNYYGTTLLYIVGEGLVPWGQGSDLGFNGGVVNNVLQSRDSYPLPTTAWLGGETTLHYQYSNEPQHAFKQTAGNLSPTSGLDFMLGRRLHHTDFSNGAHSEAGNPVFTAQAGKLGAKYIARSCVQCHVNNGRALQPSLGQLMTSTNLKLGSDSTGSPHPILGSFLQPKSLSGPAEGSATISSYNTIVGQYDDGTPWSLQQPNYTFAGTTPSHYSARLAPALVGMGLLEAISESSVLALADPADSDADGISGRAQIITDPETGQPRLGRFGYKGSHAKVSHQVAGALNADMGVTTSVFPVMDGGGSGASGISDDDLELMTRYTALLGVQARRDLSDAQAIQGEALFASAGCVKCHTPEFTTSPNHPMAEVRSQTIHPYTDMLLHDLGPDLADNMGEGIAAGSEWRTSPLWNIGHTAEVNEAGEAYLHDGRARTLEEAILWHGGEAESSRETFRTMPAASRAAIIKFLKSL